MTAEFQAAPVSEASLQQHIKAALARAQDSLSHDQVADIIRQVIGSAETGPASAGHDVRFYREIAGLAQYIRNTKLEIAAIRSKDIAAQHIPAATDQLDAVVGATEEATNKIMDECDAITNIASTLSSEQAERLTGCVTRIYEACNFQDLAGQRISKVVGALKHIEEKVRALYAALGDDADGDITPAVPVVASGALPSLQEKDLLNGPQLPGAGVSQDEIDKLFD